LNALHLREERCNKFINLILHLFIRSHAFTSGNRNSSTRLKTRKVAASGFAGTMSLRQTSRHRARIAAYVAAMSKGHRVSGGVALRTSPVRREGSFVPLHWAQVRRVADAAAQMQAASPSAEH
jgi:hypothetical protein